MAAKIEEKNSFPPSGVRVRAEWHFLLRSLAQNGTHFARSLRQRMGRMKFRVEIASRFLEVSSSVSQSVPPAKTEPRSLYLWRPMQLVPDSAREIRRVRRRSDKSFMCQFQHLAWPPSAFSQAGRARAGGRAALMGMQPKTFFLSRVSWRICRFTIF